MSLQPSLCSVHTHSTLCDGRDTPSVMAEAAYQAGVRYFGFSGHSHTPISYDEGNVLPADLTAYREEVLCLRRKYAGRMEILLGIEWDSCAEEPPPADLNYWIGSVHNLYDPATGKYHAVDWEAERLAACCLEMFRGNFPALVRQYYADVAAVAVRKPTILGHLDLVAKFNEGNAVFDEEDRHYRFSALEALHAADPAATLLEVNTGAVVRGYRTAPYPALFLLREWRSMGGHIILTSDAHSAGTVVGGYDLAAAAARAAGYRESILLTGGGMVSCPLG